MSWLDRQSFLGADSDRVLAGLTIGFVGLGGGGSHVVQQCAHLGIGAYVLIDPQAIDETNLNRLVGATLEDVLEGRAKVDIARRLIFGVQPSATVHPIQSEWQLVGDLLKTCDIIVGALDSVRAKNELDAFCRRFLIPYIDMGMDVHRTSGGYLIAGQVVLSSPGTPCLRCLGVVTDKALEREAMNYGAAGGHPQVVWPNGVLASTAVGLLMQLVTPWHDRPVAGAYMAYDGNRHTMGPSDRLVRAQARPCLHYPFYETGDPGFDVRQTPAPVEEEAQIDPGSWCNRLLCWIGRLFR